MKKISKTFLKELIIILISIVIGVLSLCIVYSLPQDRMYANVERSATLYNENENRVDNWVGVLRYGRIDNSTDRLMINSALCRGYDSTIKNALLNPYYSIKQDVIDKNGYGIDLFLDKDNISSIGNYARYWHGYLLFIIPGLMFYSVGGLRVLMMSVQFILMMLILIRIDKINHLYTFAYAFAMLFINPVTTALNFQNGILFILILISTLFILYKNDWLLKKDRYYLLFTIIGVLTSFFDLLTYPIVSFGIPMITYLIMNDTDYKEKIKKIICCGLSWAFGYGLMWFGKWASATLLTDTNVIKDAINQANYRSSGIDSVCTDLSIGNVFFTFYESLNDQSTITILLLMIIGIIAYAVITKKRIRIDKHFILNSLPYLLVGLSSVVWALIVRNHFISHNFLEYRSMSQAVLSIFIIAIHSIRKF